MIATRLRDIASNLGTFAGKVEENEWEGLRLLRTSLANIADEIEELETKKGEIHG